MPDHSNKSIYVGPARPFGLPIKNGTILADSPEKIFPQLANLFEKHKPLKKMFVPVEKFASARASLKSQGSELSILYAETAKASENWKKEQKQERGE